MFSAVKKFLWVVAGSIFCLQHLFASEYLPITRLRIDQGLSNNYVNAIFQDHHGFMWFGTYDGLNRFDGKA